MEIEVSRARPAASGAEYAAVASFYDRLTTSHDHGLWLAAIEPLLRGHGLSGRRVLDVGCGTGKSTAALRDLGYDVTGVDASREMLALAAVRTPGVPLVHADVREMVVLGPFDACFCLCDVVNHLGTEADVDKALRALRRNLRPGGLLVFDANTLHAYREHFSATSVLEDSAGLVVWRGATSPELERGGAAELLLEAFTRRGRRYERVTARLRQHHHPPDVLGPALTRAGFELLSVHGHGFDARPVQPLDEGRHTKALYIARRTGAPEE